LHRSETSPGEFPRRTGARPIRSRAPPRKAARSPGETPRPLDSTLNPSESSTQLALVWEPNHRPQGLASLHRREGLLGLVELDRPGDHRVELEPAVSIPLGEHREVARGQAVAVPGHPERAAQVEELLERQVDGW